MAAIDNEQLYDDFYDVYDSLTEELVDNADFANEFYDGDKAKANKEITKILDYLADIVGYITGYEDGDDAEKDDTEDDDTEDEDENEEDSKKKEDE